ncbi:Phosphate transport system permease protein PstC (TC 3.A.1.7.1) [hydrothermal vent metagenome]|uniref:Phosphate transport system permease protein PstC (TC 3.A.1.7.1) n=1 Tax=hydrothermal vent metagenome TaxID=652676 RepID=A0A3B1CC81_9ZZZZ
MTRLYLHLSAILSAIFILVIPVVLLFSSLPFWMSEGLAPIGGSDWYPYENLYGLLPAIVGTIWAVIIAFAIAIPSGISSAIIFSELTGSRLSATYRVVMEMVSAIPSIVYGLIGLAVGLPMIESLFDLPTGHSLFLAGMVLALMILPTFTLMSLDAISSVSVEQRESAMNLGLSFRDLLLRVLLPQAWPAIRSAILLSAGRALGETMAVMLLVGSIDRLPDPLYNILAPAQTLTSKIGREIGEAAYGSIHFSALMASGALLAVMSLVIAMMANIKDYRTAQ